MHCADGTTHCLPWLQTRYGGLQHIRIKEAARLPNPNLPAQIRLSGIREGRTAHQLRHRAYRKHLSVGTETLYWQCRNELWLSGFLVLGFAVLFGKIAWPLRGGISSHPEVDALLPWSYWVLLYSLMVSLAFCFLAPIIFYALTMRRNLLEAIRFRRIVYFRTECHGIEITRRNGEISRYDWKDLTKVSSIGHLCFGGERPTTLALSPNHPSEWRFFLDALRKTSLPKSPEQRPRSKTRTILFLTCSLLFGALMVLSLHTLASFQPITATQVSALLCAYVCIVTFMFVLPDLESKVIAADRLFRKIARRWKK